MSEEDIKFPDVNYGTANKKKYEELKNSDWSPFFGKDYWEIFIFSMISSSICSLVLFPNLMAASVTTKVNMGSPALLRIGPIGVG